MWLNTVRTVSSRRVVNHIRAVNGHAAALACGRGDFVADDFALVEQTVYLVVGGLFVSRDQHAAAETKVRWIEKIVFHIDTKSLVADDFAAVQLEAERERLAVGGIPEDTARAVHAVRWKTLMSAVFHPDAIDGHAAAVAISLIVFDGGRGV